MADFFPFFGRQSPAPECHRPPLLAQSPESGAEAMASEREISDLQWIGAPTSPEKSRGSGLQFQS